MFDYLNPLLFFLGIHNPNTKRRYDYDEDNSIYYSKKSFAPNINDANDANIGNMMNNNEDRDLKEIMGEYSSSFKQQPRDIENGFDNIELDRYDTNEEIDLDVDIEVDLENGRNNVNDINEERQKPDVIDDADVIDIGCFCQRTRDNCNRCIFDEENIRMKDISEKWGAWIRFHFYGFIMVRTCVTIY